jgi:hypothetical protein
MPLTTEIPATASFNTLLVGLEAIVEQAARYNPSAWKHFCPLDADRLRNLSNSVTYILSKTPPSHVCGLQGYNPMLGDPPCPACEAMSNARP